VTALFHRLILLIVLAGAAIAPLRAQTPTPPVAGSAPMATTAPSPLAAQRQTLDAAKLQLDQLDRALQNRNLTDAQLADLRRSLTGLPDRIRAVIDDVQPRVELLKVRLKELGPKPADPSSEVADISRERDERERSLQENEEVARLARTLALQSDQILTQIIDKRRELFNSRLFAPSGSILSPELWYAVVQNLPRDADASRTLSVDITQRIIGQLGIIGIAVLFVLCALLLFASLPLYRLFTSFFVNRHDDTPTPLGRDMAAATYALAALAVSGTFAILINTYVTHFKLLPPRLEDVLVTVLSSFVIMASARALADGILAPARPQWRLVKASDATAAKLLRYAYLMLSFWALMRITGAVNTAISSGLALTVATRGIFAVLIILTFASALRSIRPFDEVDEKSFGTYVNSESAWIGPARIVGWCVVAIALAALVSGYIAFGSFLAVQITWAVTVIATTTLLVGLTDHALERLISPTSRVTRFLYATVGLPRSGLDQLFVLAQGILRLVIIAIGGLAVLAPWGFESDDFIASIKHLFFGFTIGDVTISFAGIFGAIILFLVGIFLTHAFQGWLQRRYLPQTSLDSGIRNSIVTGVGYIGFIAAGALSFSYVGLSLEKITIVAGALSVGIGFGLQSIVNNFVSGLILLWERGIRVGDLIVVGEEQGYVKRINVRATEIETFDRATVIVPNSNLVSGVVKNRVHTDRVGRVIVPVPVPKESDCDRVANILRESAASNQEVLEDPAPRVNFKTIGESSLTFELVCFVPEVETAARVSSDLTFAIFRKLRENDIIKLPPPFARMEIVNAEAFSHPASGAQQS
jgi:small-conductance mechanosensitive channel